MHVTSIASSVASTMPPYCAVVSNSCLNRATRSTGAPGSTMCATLSLESIGAVACEPHREGPDLAAQASCAATAVALQNLLGAGEVDCTRFEILARSLRARPRVRSAW